MAEKVALMRLKVDLQCSKCCKKVKKVPQVRSQVFDEKQNMVNITVVCCDPEKIRDKLCCKGGGAIKSIEIVEPPKKPDEKKKDGDKPKSDGDKPKGGGGEGEKKKDAGPKKDGGDKPKDKGGDKPADKPKDNKPADSKPTPAGPVAMQVQPPPPVAIPAGMVVAPYYEGYPSGPYHHGYVQPVPAIVYDGYYGRPVYDSYGVGGRPVYVSRCDQYLSEENPQGCSIM
ncbi:heavy metal-associated isoprenylated plant protein 6-like [Neltuma alba]|uniref:heavy metal-associated isoprenylated plant protein 6-like n=1 Tax=Neltuma alba TaxID=207710 RepID=UPI0010A542D1|nr:heavy metal-associated isoprenylated plant protein 6-like [Prosopis alba]